MTLHDHNFLAKLTAILSVVLLSSSSAAARGLPGAKDKWIELRTPHFVFFSDSRESVVEELARDLEQLNATLGQIAPVLDSPVPTYIYMFSSDRRFDPYKPLYGGKPAAVNGYFLPQADANYIALNGDTSYARPRETLFHEYTHYVMRNNFGTLPTWFNEGIAELYSTFLVENGEAKIGLAVREHVYWLRRHSLIPLRQLFTIDPHAAEYNEGERRGVFYAQSWALVHYLMIGNPERLPQVKRYLAEEPLAETAFADAFGATAYETLESELTAYVRQTIFALQKLPAEPLPTGALASRQLDHPEVLYRLGDLLAHQLDDRHADAVEHFQAALAVQPDHALALSGMGYVAENEGRTDDALAFYERAAAAAPDHYLPAYRLGTLLLAHEDARALGLLTRSVEAAPRFGPAWIALGDAAALADEPPPELVALLERNHEQRPRDAQVATALLRVCGLTGRLDAARRLFDGTFRQAPARDRDWARSTLASMENNAAGKLFRENRLDEARALFTRALETAGDDPGLRAQIMANLRQIEAQADEERFTERYNQAVTLFNARQFERVVEVLEELLPTLDEGSDQAEAARDFLEKARAELAKGGR